MSNSSNHNPPKWIRKFLESFLETKLAEAVVGDLEEKFQSHLSNNMPKWKASSLYVMEGLGFVKMIGQKRTVHQGINRYDMFQNYLKIGYRNLIRNKMYSIINTSGLSLGLASVMLIILYVKDESSFDRFHSDAESIYRIVIDVKTPDPATTGKMGNTSVFDGPHYASAIPEIESFVRLKNEQYDIKAGDQVKSQTVFRADTNFFSFFTFPFIKGNPKTALMHPSSIVLSEDMANNLFGTTDVLNKIILVNKNNSFEPHTITGITKRCPQNSSIKFDLIIPFNEPSSNANGVWLECNLYTFVKLSDQAVIGDVNARMQRVFEKEANEILTTIRSTYGQSVTFEHLIQPLRSIHLSEEFTDNYGLSDSSKQSYSYILSGIALFILLIASGNFINLMVAQSVKRSKEVGIRKVIGGKRSELIKQFLGESFILSGVAFILALLVAQLILPVFNGMVNKNLALSYLLDMKLVIGYITLFLFTGLVSGFYPAVVLSGYNPLQTIRSRFQVINKNYFQKILVTLEFTLATVLTLAAIIVYQQFDHLTKMDWGLNTKNIVTVHKNQLMQGEFELMRDQLLKDSNIQAVTHSGWNGMWGFEAEKQEKVFFSADVVDEKYLGVLTIPIKSGRNFSPDITSDFNGAVIVNELFVKAAGWNDPVGMEFTTLDGSQKLRVIGVMGDYHRDSPLKKNEPHLLVMNSNQPHQGIHIKIVPGAGRMALKTIEQAFKKTFPLVPYQYSFMEDQYLQGLAAEARWKRVTFVGACITIFISFIGMFGLAMISGERRFKEIGIRKVLGASVSTIVITLSRDFIKVVCVAIFIAIPISYYFGNRWLESYPEKTQLNVLIFFIAGFMIVLLAFLSTCYQSVKAALMNPVNSLKSE